MTAVSPGTIAPPFAGVTHLGEAIDSGSYRGAKLWLSFYRYASCPMCNYRIHEIVARYDQFASAGIRVVGVMQSPPEKIAVYAKKRKVPFPIIADPEMALYEKYGLESKYSGMFKLRVFATAVKAMFKGIFPGIPEGDAHRLPAEFLIDPEGLVWDSFYGEAVSDHIPFDRVLEFARDDCLTVPTA